jgi:outer membrane immunogenic protein
LNTFAEFKEDGMMKRVFGVSVVALLALGVQANAADLGRRPMAAPAPVYAPVYNWTGLYIGVNGGGGWGDSHWTGQTSRFSTSGGMIGGTAGYNWQFGQTVFGLEADIDWANIRGTGFCTFGCETKADWLGTVRGRLGYAWDRFMPYVTGGLAFGNIQANPAFGFAGDSTTNAGWTIGAGVEFALAQNWTAKVEYLHYDLGSFTCTTCAPVATKVDFNADVVRGGVNFRF